MTTCSFHLSVTFVIFLVNACSFAQAQATPSNGISLVREPEEIYYLTRKSPVFITCRARNAVEIVFNCMGKQIPETSMEIKDGSDITSSLKQAKIAVTRADVQNLGGKEPFWCMCGAVDFDGRIAVTSRRGYVFIAYLKNKFSRQPTNTTANVGENVELVCGPPEGLPEPKIIWRKDGKRLNTESDPRLIITDMSSLVIKSATKEDAGSYCCVAMNVASRHQSECAYLTIIALEESAEPAVVVSEDEEAKENTTDWGKPRATRQSLKTYFTLEPQEKYYVSHDKPTVIDCAVIAADILTFKCNGKRLERERQNIKQGLDSSGNRNIRSQVTITYAEVQAFLAETRGSQTFKCGCSAWFHDSSQPKGWGKIDSSDDLGLVYPAYLDSDFYTEPSDTTAAVNTDVTLICDPPKGQPSPWVRWDKNDERLDPRASNKYSVTPTGYLVIHSVQYDDSGTYSCTAENVAKSVRSRAARLAVVAQVLETTSAAYSDTESVPDFPEVIPNTPVFLRDFQPEYILDRDGTKVMVCAVMSADQMTVECGGKRLASQDYELKSKVHSPTGKHLQHAKIVVTAEQVAENPDNYFCQCTAWYLNEQNGWENVISARGFVRLPAVSSYIGDQFAISPKDTEADFEAHAELVCKPPEGNPVPTVYWLKDGVRIDPNSDPNFVIVDDGTLIIEFVHVTDEGVYICVAENEAGTKFSNPARLTVLGKPELPKTTAQSIEVETTTLATEHDFDVAVYRLTEPFFSMVPSPENYIIMDEPVTLSCTVIAAKSLVFVCNGEVVTESVTTDTSTTLDTKLPIHENSLVITKEQIEAYTRSEPYTCLCRAYYEEEGSDSKQLKTIDSSPAVIQVAYLKSQFLQEPSDTEVAYLGRAELVCKAPEGNPEPEIHWLKNGFRIILDERVRVDKSGSLIIDKFTQEDEGRYTCLAENLARSRTSRTATITLSVSSSINDWNVTEAGIKQMQNTTQPEQEVATQRNLVEIIHSGTPYFSKDLHSVYYLVNNKPATISCEAYAVDFITITCGEQRVEDQIIKERMESQILSDGRFEMVKVTEASINVSKDEVENYDPGKQYWCQCLAHYHVPGIQNDQILESMKGVVEIAYLDRNFKKEPKSQTVKEGDTLTIMCQPPDGSPTPKISWEKDGDSLQTQDFAPSGVLIFPKAELEHTGEYVCVAENEAGRSSSSPAFIEVKAMDDPWTKTEIPDDHVDCEDIVSSCSVYLPNSVNIVEFCATSSEYVACMENYIKKCSHTNNDNAMIPYMDIQRRCSSYPKCPELESCKRVWPNSPVHGLTVHNFCSDGNNLFHCVDNALHVCNVTLSTSEEKMKQNLFAAVKWFTEFCDRMILDSPSLVSCDGMLVCDQYIQQAVTVNASWCWLMDHFVRCTNEAVNTCTLDELKGDLEYLSIQADDIFCSDDDTESGYGGPWAEVRPEAEGEAESEGGGKLKPNTETKLENIEGDTGNIEYDKYDDEADSENINKKAAAAKGESESSSATLNSSVLLIITLLTVVMSLR